MEKVRPTGREGDASAGPYTWVSGTSPDGVRCCGGVGLRGGRGGGEAAKCQEREIEEERGDE